MRELAMIDLELGRRGEASSVTDRAVATFPWSALVRSYRGEVRACAGDISGAAEDLRFAIDHGHRPPDWAIERARLGF